MKKRKILLWLQVLGLCAMLLASTLPALVIAEHDQDQTPNVEIERSVTMSYLLNGQTEYQPLTPPYQIADITKLKAFRALYSFSLVDHFDNDTGLFSRTVRAGDYYTIELPKRVVVQNPAGGDIKDAEGQVIATYAFIQQAADDWQVKITFTSYVDDTSRFEIYGYLQFDFAIDLTGIGQGSTTTVVIPIDNDASLEIKIVNPIPPETKPSGIAKAAAGYNEVTRQLTWTVTLSPDTGIFEGCVFTDTLDPRTTLLSIKHGSVTLAASEYTYNAATGAIVYTVPTGRNGASYRTLTLVTEVKASVYGSLTPTVISNQCQLTGGEDFVSLLSNEATYTVRPTWLSKTGTTYQGNRIQWTITANTNQQKLYNGVVTDYFAATVKLDTSSVKVGGSLITIYTSAHTPANATEIYGVYTINGDGTSKLVIYLPRGAANASTAKRTITLITDVVAPSTVTASDPKYYNNATLEGNFVSDGNGEGTVPTTNITQVGVTVPYVSVVKGHSSLTAADKSNGTITWTITAASNLSDYGKSVIVDTLPADQEFIPDQIYLGSLQLSPATEPSVAISADGRTLTITYNTTINALATQKVFTVKTKIKPEIYGTNLDRNFTNNAKASLLDADTGAILITRSDDDQIYVQNRVIVKANSTYTGNNTTSGQNPRVNFTITINENLMPLQDVVVTDNLDNIATEYKKKAESSFTAISGLKWKLVAGSVSVTRVAGSQDTFSAAGIAANATYLNNLLTVPFGSGVSVKDKYAITFTVELDISQNAIFEQNGTLRCKGNIGSVTAIGLNGTISSAPTGGSNEIKNVILGKAGIHVVTDQQAVWTISLNQHHFALQNTRVVDILPLGLTLDPTDIKLYKNVIGPDSNFLTGDQAAAQGTEVPFTYTLELSTDPATQGRYVLTVTLPDNQTAYILRFATDINRSLLGKTIVNSSFFVGEEETEDNTDTVTVTFSATAGGGSQTKTYVTVNKKDSETGESITSPATFALYWLRNHNASDPVYVRSLQTTNGTVTFYGLSRGELYTVTEVKAPEGYKLDSGNPILVSAPLAGQGDIPAVNFCNTPEKTGSWMPTALKKLDGKGISRAFQFEIYDQNRTLMLGTLDTALPNGDYTIKFNLNTGVSAAGLLSFTDDHTFPDSAPNGSQYLAATRTIYMKELAVPEWTGYSFDPTVHTLVLKVYNVKGRDTLKIVVEDAQGNVLTNDGGQFTAAGTPVFQNVYRADGSIQFAATKILEGHNLAAEQFSFKLYEGNTLLQTVQNGQSALVGGAYVAGVQFSAIHYTQADVGTKNYRIVEQNDGQPGYSYDTAEYLITVSVSDNDNGTLTAVVTNLQKKINGTKTAAESIRFTNRYTTTGTSVNLSATKTLSGRTLQNGQFSFILERVDSEGNVLETLATVQNNGSGIQFPALNYTQADIGATYYYRVSEQNGGASGYTYDAGAYLATVTISDNNDGTIKSTVAYTKNGETVTQMSFGNAYKASGSTEIKGTKALTGKALPAELFTFALQQYNASGEAVGEPVTVTNAADGSFSFPALEFTEADAGNTYYYKVTEQNGGAPGYTYDATVYSLQVSVTDNGDGTLAVNQLLAKPADSIVFTNDYRVKDTSLQLRALKVLLGRTLEEGQFGFTLSQTNEAGEITAELETMRNGANGSISFAPLTYSQADMGKTFHYVITEQNAGSAGYAYDEASFAVTVTVTDNGDGTLTAAAQYLLNAQPVEGALFSNTYTTTDTGVLFTAHKTLTGRTLEEGQFTFMLKEVTASGDFIREVERVQNGADGNIAFGELVYKQADMGKTFYYQISEVNDSQPGYIYDVTQYSATVTVLDNGDGTLSAEVAITSSGEAVTLMTFANTYHANGLLEITARKVLRGANLKAKQFSFNLYQGETLLETVQNDATGAVLFETLHYTQTQLGVYEYTVTETAGSAEHYTYDATLYKLTVTVSDNGDGTLNVQSELTAQSGTTAKAAKTILFENKYNPPEPPPNTGDISTLWYALGALVALAGVGTLLVVRRKKEQGEG